MTRRVAMTGAVVVALLAPFGFLHAQEIGRLYAARPPAGSAYLRFVTDAETPISVGIEGLGSERTIPSDGHRATSYRVVKGGKAATIMVGGRAATTITPEPDRFTTVFISKEQGKRPVSIADATEGGNDLKADLRVYNLISGCLATVSVRGGPAVFNDVGESETRRRVINPIEAELTGQCGQAVSAPYRLPPLKAGDHYSLFLVGTVEAPVLAGQQDETEAYQRSE